ncbi:MAG: hypothetical protein OXU83_02555 [Gammaproteobacteria bacterium]|nr:hypothetical protein [Gammaproteobacteria bacterium]
MMEKQEKAPVPTPEATAALAKLYVCDAAFRAEFDKDPKAALAAVGGEPLPSDVEVVVHRNESNRWHVTLPSEEIVEELLQEISAEMKDEDLKEVSGGMSREEKLQWHIDRQRAAMAGNWPPPRRSPGFFTIPGWDRDPLTGWDRDPFSGRPIPPG